MRFVGIVEAFTAPNVLSLTVENHLVISEVPMLYSQFPLGG
jgi:hypothetical protein